MIRVLRGGRATACLPLFLLLLLVALRPAPVAAHANLVQSDPPAQSSVTRAPGTVQLLFSETVEPRSIEVRVLNQERQPVDQGDARLADGSRDTVVLTLGGDLPPGVYTISWAVTSTVDGHTTRGLVPFSIGDPGAVPEPLSADEIGAATTEQSDLQSGPVGVVARWLTLLSMLALGGLVVAGRLLAPAAAATLQGLRSGADDVEVTEDAPRRVLGAMAARTVRLLWLALGLFAAGSVLLLLVDVAAGTGDSIADVFGTPLADYFGTRRGVLWLVRAGLALVLTALLAVLVQRRDSNGVPFASPLWSGLALLVAGMLLATSLGSHSASIASGAALATAVDWVHLVAVAVWTGGLLFLALAFLPAMRPLAGPARTRLLAVLVPAFSRIAFISVVVILLTGLYQTWQLLDGWSALRELQWGRALVVKLALFVGLLALAAVNLLYIKPRLDQYARRMDRRTREHAAALRVTFRRVVLAEAGLAVVVLLVVGVLTGVTPSEATAGLADGPFRPFILDSAAENLSGRLVLSPGRIGPNRFDLTVTGAGGGALAGDATTVLRISTLDEDTGIAEVPTERLGPGRFTAAGSYLSTVGFWEIVAIVRQPGLDDVSLPFRLSLTEATGRPRVEEVVPAAPLARGRELYQQNCVQCHGDGGRGDGPLAASLRPPPLDLTVHVPLHGDAELREWITNGVPRTAMPAFGGQFTPEEIQAVVNYIRELAKQGAQTR